MENLSRHLHDHRVDVVVLGGRDDNVGSIRLGLFQNRKLRGVALHPEAAVFGRERIEGLFVAVHGHHAGAIVTEPVCQIGAQAAAPHHDDKLSSHRCHPPASRFPMAGEDHAADRPSLGNAVEVVLGRLVSRIQGQGGTVILLRLDTVALDFLQGPEEVERLRP